MRDRLMAQSFALVALMAAPGCIYANVTTPMAYRSPTPADVGGTDKLGEEVEGRACNHQVLWLVAWGDGGYAKAVEQATRGKGSATVVADVQADNTELNILGIYGRRCTVVHARVLK